MTEVLFVSPQQCGSRLTMGTDSKGKVGQDATIQYDGGTITGPEADVRRVVAEIEEGRARRARWPESGADAMTALTSGFPSLSGAPGVDPWNQDVFLQWLCSKGLSHGELLAARFVLGVWNASTAWDEIAREAHHPYPENAKRFDVLEAYAVWDRRHVDAFLAWADAPFWP